MGFVFLGFGGGVAFFETRTLTNQRIPTSEHQVGMIPWKTSICKKPGEIWYFNLSMKSENFEPGFSFYADYIFTQHSKDTIELKESDPIRSPKFIRGIEKMLCISPWKAQHYTAGIKYDITSSCSLSIAIQGYINGIRTYRVTTMLGSFSIAI